MRKIRMTVCFIIVLITISCDPFYSITVTNETTDTAKILVKNTVNFSSQKQKTQTTSDGYDVYSLAPKEKVMVGTAIAEIDNDIPFEQIKIVKFNDTISANNLIDIKNLFDKKFFGGLKKPYNISIE